jgi:hypothetical protein
MARRLVNNPHEDDQREIERLRQTLLPQLDTWDALYRISTHGTTIVVAPAMCSPSVDNLSDFSDSEDEVMNSTRQGDTPASNTRAQVAAGATDTNYLGPPETRRLAMPSILISCSTDHRKVELQLRVQQASKTLEALRDKIADKSFHYSHVIRVAPKKGVKTRARTIIAKLDQEINYHSHVYRRCRTAMARLGADDATLEQYQKLLKEHVKSSTALLNPNEPGSTRVRLSWIWQTVRSGDNLVPAALRECER